MSRVCVYGAPPPELAATPAHAQQVSPLIPGGLALESMPPGSLDAVIMAAPPGTLERRYALALALVSLRPGAPLTAMAPKDRGGARLGAELRAFGCEVEETGRKHSRVCHVQRPSTLPGVEEALEQGGPRFHPALGRWTQPGVFSWDRPDPGTSLLLESLPPLTGSGADLGCGTGTIAQAVLAAPAVTRLDLVDLDRRAVDAARRNLPDPRAVFHWADARSAFLGEGLDFVVMNPPFHQGGAENRALGQDFIRAAHRLLRSGGTVRLVANRHLPYEAVLASLFSRTDVKAERQGFKVLEAIK